MKNKQIYFLFSANFAIYFIGTGLFPLLPIYATTFGASKSIIGIYMAITYISLTSGTLFSRLAAGALGPKRVFVGAGVLGVLGVILLGQAAALWQAIILSAVVWFTGGLGLALIAVFIGQSVQKTKRGKSFGIIFLSFPLASLLSGLTVGPIFEWHGTNMMFIFLGAVYAIWPLVGWLFVKVNPIVTIKTTQTQSAETFGKPFYLLLIMTFLPSIAMYAGRLGISFTMTSLDFSVSAISSTTAVAGLVTIPLAIVLGTWSDKLGRQLFLLLCFMLVAVSGILLSTSTQLWQFWLASILIQVANAVRGSIFPAYATDILPPKRLAAGLTWLNGINGFAGILGLALTGLIIEQAGTTTLFVGAASLALVCLAILGVISGNKLVTAVQKSHNYVSTQVRNHQLKRANAVS